MSKKSTPFKTPSGFFENQQRSIWEQASDSSILLERTKSGVPSWTGWTVGIAAALVLALVIGPEVNDPECQTFACLWEATPSESLQLDDREFDLWMEDDLLFETIINDATDV